MKKDIIVTTSDVLQGYEISEYCGYIDTSLTVGSGLFTDVASNWTDAFGFRSKAIENKLHLLKDEAIKNLSEKAKKLKCNAIVGLSVDVDEISSGQKMIFMITAIGTAVKCKRTNEESSLKGVSGYYLEQKLIRAPKQKEELASILRKIESGNPEGNIELNGFSDRVLEEDSWDFIEYEYLQCFVANAFCFGNTNVLTERIKEVLDNFDILKLSKFFLDIMLDVSKDTNKILELRKTDTYKHMCKYFSSLISLELIHEYMQKGNDYFSVIVIYPLLQEIKEYYNEKDLETLEMIVSCFKKKYWNESIKIEELASDERICMCGSVLKGSTPCTCGETSTISSSTYASKVKVVKQLEKLISELKEYFSN